MTMRTSKFTPPDGVNPEAHWVVSTDLGSMAVSFATPAAVEHFRTVLFRGLNTYDDAPEWMHHLCDALQPKKEPMT